MKIEGTCGGGAGATSHARRGRLRVRSLSMRLVSTATIYDGKDYRYQRNPNVVVAVAVGYLRGGNFSLRKESVTLGI